MKLNMKRFAFSAAMMASCAIYAAPVQAASSEQTRYTHSSCEGPNAICGAIVIASAGSFTLDWTSVDARDSQPAGQLTHEKCSGVSKKIKDDVPSGNYNTYIVPASCAYKIKLKILSANNKDQNLYLSPGCRILAKVEGDAVSNNWNFDVSAMNDQVPTNSNNKPVDMAGHKCGRLNKAGF